MVLNYNIFLSFAAEILSFGLILQIYSTIHVYFFTRFVFSVFLLPGNGYKNSIFNLASKLSLNYQTFLNKQKHLL